MTPGGMLPAVGIGYRAVIDRWTRDNLDRFDVLEITVDHCIGTSKTLRSAIFDLVGRIPLTAHGVGLSLGTDTPLDLAYLDLVAEVQMAGVIPIRDYFAAKPLLADSHSHPVPHPAFDLLEFALAGQAPSAIILERDDRLDAGDETLADIARNRARVAAARARK